MGLDPASFDVAGYSRWVTTQPTGCGSTINQTGKLFASCSPGLTKTLAHPRTQSKRERR